MEVLDSNRSLVTSLQEFTDANGEAVLRWKIPRRQAAGAYSAEVTTILKNGYEYSDQGGITSVLFTIQ
jgi:hypothetical protein